MLLGDPRFQNHVAAKYFLMSYYLDQTNTVVSTLVAVDAEIGRQVTVLTEQ